MIGPWPLAKACQQIGFVSQFPFLRQTPAVAAQLLNPLALSLLPLSQPDARAATVLFDELYAGVLQRLP
jgi:hypothetical protein